MNEFILYQSSRWRHTELAKRRGSDGQNGPQGCLLHDNPRGQILEVHKVHVGREHLQVYMHDVRAGTSAQNIYEDHENPHYLLRKLKI